MSQILRTPTQLGTVIAARRKTLKLSQSDVGERLSLSQARYSTLEKHPDRITLDRLLALANTLGLEVVVREKSPEPSSSRSEW